MKKIDTLIEDIYEKVSVVADGEQLDVTDPLTPYLLDSINNML